MWSFWRFCGWCHNILRDAITNESRFVCVTVVPRDVGTGGNEGYFDTMIVVPENEGGANADMEAPWSNR